MHKVVTGRLMAQVAAGGDSLMGTVPAGKVWQVLSVVIWNQVRVPGALGAVRFVDSVSGAFSQNLQNSPASSGLTRSNDSQTDLAAGDQVVFHNANASTFSALVTYLER